MYCNFTMPLLNIDIKGIAGIFVSYFVQCCNILNVLMFVLYFILRCWSTVCSVCARQRRELGWAGLELGVVAIQRRELGWAGLELGVVAVQRRELGWVGLGLGVAPYREESYCSRLWFLLHQQSIHLEQ